MGLFDLKVRSDGQVVFVEGMSGLPLGDGVARLLVGAPAHAVH